jgi:hypothetical protein
MSTNPFTYYKKPSNHQEAQSNVNYWWFEGMGDCPIDTIEAHWNTYIKEMKRSAAKELQIFSIDK